jgi:hypothetical protein
MGLREFILKSEVVAQVACPTDDGTVPICYRVIVYGNIEVTSIRVNFIPPDG